MYVVLDRKGDSDHKPLVSDWRYSNLGKRKQFRAGGWNMHRPDLADVRGALDNLLDYDLDLLFMIEYKERSNVDEYLAKQGLGVIMVEPEFGLAFNRSRFAYVRHHRRQTSPVEYWTINYCLIVVLWDRIGKREIKCWVGHPPAHVTVESHKTWPKVFEVHKDYADLKARVAERSRMPLLGFEDLNIDPVKDSGPATANRFVRPGRIDYHRAPKPTRGNRHIDNMFDDGLVLVR